MPTERERERGKTKEMLLHDSRDVFRKEVRNKVKSNNPEGPISFNFIMITLSWFSFVSKTFFRPSP